MTTDQANELIALVAKGYRVQYLSIAISRGDGATITKEEILEEAPSLTSIPLLYTGWGGKFIVIRE